jgi:hypothetical protein
MKNKTVPPSKPRNFLAIIAKFKSAGSHTKPYKSLRKQQKQQLKKDNKDNSFTNQISCIA